MTGLPAPGPADGRRGEARVATLPETAAGRLDRSLALIFPDLSRTRLQALIQAGQVSVDGALMRDPSSRPPPGGQVVLTVPEAADPMPAAEPIALDIVFEDDSLIVVDKSAGLVVHPGAGHGAGTLVNALIAHCGASLSGIGGVRRPGIVHRLDKDTSGLLVVAKSDPAHRSLAAQFADHGRSGPLERAYLAFAWGVPEPARGTIDAPLARSTANREKIVVTAGGRRAVTHYAVEETYGGGASALLRCRLETGRTHQIRVHLAARRHPLLGDATYGAGFGTKANLLGDAARDALAALGRQALHAALLQFEHPLSGHVLRFESALPADLERLRSGLRADPAAPPIPSRPRHDSTR